MIVGIICLLIFLFTIYQLSKDDFLFIRKGVSVENVFNIVFLSLPITLLSARFFYILFHPSWNYLNPLIFFVIPYFPGLSLVGGILGAWIFITIYTKNKKIPSQRLLDMISLSFLLTMSIGILLEALPLIRHMRVIGVEEIGRSVLGIMLYIVLLLQFIKGAWSEGSMIFFIVSMCCMLSFMNIGTLFFLHQSVSIGVVIATGILFIVSLALFAQRQKFFRKLVGR